MNILLFKNINVKMYQNINFFFNKFSIIAIIFMFFLLFIIMKIKTQKLNLKNYFINNNIKTVLITGASRGIGKQFAIELAKYNVNSMIIDIDLSVNQSAITLYNLLDKKNIKIDFLINNAAFSIHDKFHKYDHDKLNKMLFLNIIAVTELCHVFIPSMIKKKTGIILNISSIASFIPSPYMTTYNATKTYINAFTNGLIAEYKFLNIVNILPGITDTNFFNESKVKLNNINIRTPNQIVITSLNAILNNKNIAIDGFKNNILVFFSFFIPKQLLYDIMYNKYENMYIKIE